MVIVITIYCLHCSQACKLEALDPQDRMTEKIRDENISILDIIPVFSHIGCLFSCVEWLYMEMTHLFCSTCVFRYILGCKYEKIILLVPPYLCIHNMLINRVKSLGSGSYLVCLSYVQCYMGSSMH